MKSNIATAINDAHASVERAKTEGTKYALEAGRLLIEAKATVPHGSWDAWVAENCKFSARTAQLYMRLCRQVEDDPAKAQRVADLSLREAARGTAHPRNPVKAGAEDTVANMILAYVPKDKQAKVIDLLEKSGARQIAKALQAPQCETARAKLSDPEEAQVHEMMSLWYRLDPDHRRDFMERLAAKQPSASQSPRR